jgi:hypothetical protein
VAFLPALGVAGAHEEPIRPGVEARRVAELRKVPPDGEQRLLRRVLGKLDVAQNSMRDGVEPITGGHGKAREGLFVATLCSSHKIGIHALFRGPVIRSGRPFTRYGRTVAGRHSIFAPPHKRNGGPRERFFAAGATNGRDAVAIAIPVAGHASNRRLRRSAGRYWPVPCPGGKVR